MKPLSKSTIIQIKKLAMKGMTLGQIADQLSVSKPTVCRKLKEAGINYSDVSKSENKSSKYFSHSNAYNF